MGAVALPKIELNGRTYFIDIRLQELRSHSYPPDSIEFINFGELPKKDLDKVLNTLHEVKREEKMPWGK